MTSVAILGVALLAAASVASLSIDAILLTQMISGRTFVQISAADAIRIEKEARGTGTREASFCVLAIVLARLRC